MRSSTKLAATIASKAVIVRGVGPNAPVVIETPSPVPQRCAVIRHRVGRDAALKSAGAAKIVGGGCAKCGKCAMFFTARNDESFRVVFNFMAFVVDGDPGAAVCDKFTLDRLCGWSSCSEGEKACNGKGEDCRGMHVDE
jgi:hypothetical protein